MLAIERRNEILEKIAERQKSRSKRTESDLRGFRGDNPKRPR